MLLHQNTETIRQKISWKCYSKYKKIPFFSKDNLILLDKACQLKEKKYLCGRKYL